MSNSPSVMVVDDEEELAHLFSKFLEGSGFNSVSFTDPLLALEEFRSNPDRYSLVLTDLRMPGLDGIQLAKSMRKYSSSAKIVLITAFNIQDNVTDYDFKKASISEILEKPIKLVDLRTHIHKLCVNERV
jgi:CheY-like chemotaxis protein